MNVETANRLMQYRKKAGLSQEELADKLGVSRQAVSKWECAESSPDTDNLIALSKIYGISLDELINEDPSPKQEEKKEEKKSGIHIKGEDGDEVHISTSGIHVKDNDGSEVHIDGLGIDVVDGKDKIHVHSRGRHRFATAESLISSLTTLGVIIAYLLLGFLIKDGTGWRNYWVLFLLIPIAPTILPAIYYRKFTAFAYPIAATMVYLSLGMFLDLWHPTWIIFLTIPVYYIVFGPIDRAISRKVIVNDNIIDAKDYDDGDEKEDED